MSIEKSLTSDIQAGSLARVVTNPWRATCLVALALLAAGVYFLPSMMREARARRALDAAVAGSRGIEKDEAPEAVAGLLRAVERDYPGTDAARRAASMRPVYEGVAMARAMYPVRAALDILRQTARAVEQRRERGGELPASLDQLVPSDMEKLPQDPWGRPLRYRASASQYEVSSLGSDGAPGGSGDAADLFVADGRVTSGLTWVDR